MLRIISILFGLSLVAYLVYESAISPRKYRRLKRAIADGDARGRYRFYGEILWFEWVSAFLAFGAVQFDFSRFNPANLQIGETAFGRWWISAWTHIDKSFFVGLVIGIVIAGAAIIVSRRKRRRAIASPASQQPASIWKKFLPDFSALIPLTPRERLRFTMVAISAGICEEVVYRAWLLDFLHGSAGLAGATLVIAAALLFGIGHYYQGYAGVLITSLLGLALCGLYVASGTLLVPIIVHALIDLRLAILPAPERPIETL